MKLSTSAYARGTAGILLALLVMGIIVALSGERASLTFVCLGGAATWLVDVWALSAAKDKEVLRSSGSLAEPHVAAASRERPDPDINQRVREYHDAVYELLRDLVAEGVVAEEALGKLVNRPSQRATAAEHSLYSQRYKLAIRRLSKLSELTPPPECIDIHNAYLRAFALGVEARRHELEGHHLKASADYQLASDELGRATDIWEKMGVGPSL
jgi:hypothetical protein